MASTGLFLVCFDSSSLQYELAGKEYYSRVGTYLDLVNQTAAIAGIKPKIMLVATKVEDLDGCQESLDKILSLAKGQLTSISSESFLVDKILKTSSKVVCKEAFEDMYFRIFTLCTADELRSRPKEAIPTSWYLLLAALKNLSQTTVDQVIQMLQQIKSENGGPSTTPKDVLESLERLRDVLMYLTEVNNSKSEKEPVKPTASNISPNRNPEYTTGKIDSEIEVLAVSSTHNNGEMQRVKSIDVEEVRSRETSYDEQSNGETVSTCYDEQLKCETITALEFLKGNGELLFYPNNPDLSETVITRPMDLVRSLRTVISHKTVGHFKKAQFQHKKLELLQKGLLCYEDFKSIYQSRPKQVFSERQVWDLLIQLGLAIPMEVNKETRQILVPSLINESMEEKVRTRGEELERHEACVSIQYNFDKDGKSIGMYCRLLKVFTESMLLGEKGGEIRMSYSQKVEQKKLGNVAGVLGVMRWHTKGIREPEAFEFLLSEHETTLPSPDPEENTSDSECYAIHRGIRVSLRPVNGKICEAMFEILSMVNAKFTLNLEQEVQSCQFCRQCTAEGKYGYFPLNEGMQIQSTDGLCRPHLEHTMDKSLVEIMQRAQEPEPFQLKSLMGMRKEDLGLEVFEKSDIKKKMLSGDLATGEQVWIYHDAVTNPNLVSRINPYSHVVVYVGPRKDRNRELVLDKNGVQIHDVVHVAKSNWRGIVVAGISKVDINSVIKPTDMVFLGHKLKACQFAGNVRQKISERAIACAEKPKLLFAYDHR